MQPAPEWKSSEETVAVIGSSSWDEFLILDRFPRPGVGAVVTACAEAGGGTAANVAVALARLGVRPLLVTTVGDDAWGQRLVSELSRERLELHLVPPRAQSSTDHCTILVSPEPERTILWSPGARLRLGDPLPLERVFQCRVVVIDVEDDDLRQFLLDLPAHVAPRTRIVGPLTHLATLPCERARRLAIQHDVLIGNEDEACAVTGCTSVDAALEALRRWMPLGATRLVAISRGRDGCILATMRETVRVPAFEVRAIDPTGAGDTFAAGIVYGLLRRLPLSELGRLANAMGALATRALGARAALPTRDELEAFLSGVSHVHR